MGATEAWNFAIGLIKVDGLEPTEDFKKYIELEKQGLATTEDIKKYLDKKYKVKNTPYNPLAADEIYAELTESRACSERGEYEDFDDIIDEISEKYGI